ncbi:MAG: ABC transporter ATP-binding protein [Phycisphaerae bacterium]
MSADKPHTPTDAPTVSVERVSKIYTRRRLWLRRPSTRPRDVAALCDVSTSVYEGEMVGLLGPNGAGKTTLLKIISTLLLPTSGRVQIYGYDVFANELRTRSLIGLVSCDERSFYWRLTARQNLIFFATLHGLSRRESLTRSGALLEALGLAHAADQPYHTFSAGMKQKLAIARGLIGEPRLILYDEPTRSLDPLSARTIRELIRQKRADAPHRTHVIATNQLDEAEGLCDRVVIINRGTIIAEGSIDEIRRRLDERGLDVYTVTYRGGEVNGMLTPAPDVGLLDVEREESEDQETKLRVGVAKNSDGLSYALNAILRASGKIIHCDLQERTFDEVFCSLVRKDQESQADGTERGEPS